MALRDLRYAFRSLGRSRGFAVVAVVSLALGLGLVTTMFALLDAVTHPYLPYRDAERLYDVRYWLSGKDRRFNPAWVYAALRDRTRLFENILPYDASDMRLGTGEGEEGDVGVASVPPRLFSVLGVRPSRGRAFQSGDAGRGVALVSDALWRSRFAGRSLAGASVALGDRRYAVVGVMPDGMRFPGGASVWLPLADDPEQATASGIMVKLKRGESRDAANAALRALSAYLTRTYHTEGAPFAFYLNPLRDDPMRLGDIHYAMLGAAIAVLLIACANLANLGLARGLARRREVALRLAIGASRGAVVRQLFTEFALIAVVGTALGMVLSVWGGALLRTAIPRELWWRGIVSPRLSWRVFGLAAMAAAGAAALAGLLPAVRVARAVSLDEPLKDGAGTTTRTRQRYSALVISEVALALVLLMGAGLLIKVVHRTARYQFNFPARQLLQSGIFLMQRGNGAPLDLLGTELRVIAALRDVPGVVDAAAISGARPAGLAVTAELAGDSTRLLNLQAYSAVTPQYLRTMGLPVLEGRDFEEGDIGGAGVAILNSVAAARLYPGGDAVGHMIKLGAPMKQAPWVPIVGVCRAVLEGPPGSLPGPDVYVVGRPDSTRRGAQVVIRTARDDARIAATLAARLKTLGPGVGAYVYPYLGWWESRLRSQGFLAELFAAMGAFALLLAAVGVYGVLAYAVSRRGREFAVRIAVGAERRDMLRLVLHDGLVMTLAGTALGGFVALWATGLLSAFLEDQNVLPTDVLTLIASELVLIAVATAASLAPALRAMRADPVEILRAT